MQLRAEAVVFMFQISDLVDILGVHSLVIIEPMLVRGLMDVKFAADFLHGQSLGQQAIRFLQFRQNLCAIEPLSINHQVLLPATPNSPSDNPQ